MDAMPISPKIIVDGACGGPFFFFSRSLRCRDNQGRFPKDQYFSNFIHIFIPRDINVDLSARDRYLHTNTATTTCLLNRNHELF